MSKPEWRRRFLSVGIEEVDADKYADLFVREDIPLELSGVQLDNAFLQSLGIEKAGHRLKMMKLVPTATEDVHPPMMDVRTPLLIARAIDVPCRNHPDREAVVQCVQRNCRGNFCLACVSRTPDGGNWWCHECRTYVQQNACCNIV